MNVLSDLKNIENTVSRIRASRTAMLDQVRNIRAVIEALEHLDRPELQSKVDVLIHAANVIDCELNPNGD